MNNEQQQIIDEAYENYEKSYEMGKHLEGTGLLWMAKETKGTFIYRSKTDPEFSENWGLKIEETYDLVPHTQICADTIITRPVRKNKIIVTYKDKTIESYE